MLSLSLFFFLYFLLLLLLFWKDKREILFDPIRVAFRPNRSSQRKTGGWERISDQLLGWRVGRRQATQKRWEKKGIGEMDRDRERESRISFIFFFIFDQDNESKSRIRRSRTPFDAIYLWIYVLGPLSLDLKEHFSSAPCTFWIFVFQEKTKIRENSQRSLLLLYTQRWLYLSIHFGKVPFLYWTRPACFDASYFLSLDHIQQDPCIVVQCTIYT
jgi:hypothetical protein